MSIITVWPSATSAAAARPIRSLTSRRSTSICANGGSLALADRAAVDALELAVARELREVAAHGHLRHAEALRQLDDVRGLRRCGRRRGSALCAALRASAPDFERGGVGERGRRACSDLFERASRDGDPIAERAGVWKSRLARRPLDSAHAGRRRVAPRPGCSMSRESVRAERLGRTDRSSVVALADPHVPSFSGGGTDVRSMKRFRVLFGRRGPRCGRDCDHRGDAGKCGAAHGELDRRAGQDQRDGRVGPSGRRHEHHRAVRRLAPALRRPLRDHHGHARRGRRQRRRHGDRARPRPAARERGPRRALPLGHGRHLQPRPRRLLLQHERAADRSSSGATTRRSAASRGSSA